MVRDIVNISEKNANNNGHEQTNETHNSPRNRKHSSKKWFIGPYCFLFVAAFNSSYSTFAQFVYAKVKHDLFTNFTSVNGSESGCVNEASIDRKDHIRVQEMSAMWTLYFSLSGGIPAVFSSIVFGSLTDKYGRKFIFFLPCAGTFIRIVVTVIGIYFNFSLKYHIIGQFIEGITGQMNIMLLACFTYIADITNPSGRERTFALTMIELSIGMASTIFSFITGYFIQATGFFYPMLASGIIICATFVIACLIPESLVEENRNSKGSISETFKPAFNVFFGPFNKGYRWKLNVLLLIFTLTIITIFGRVNIEPIYQLGPPFCWSPKKLGYFGALKGFLQQVIGMGLIKVLQMLIADEAIAMIGCVSFAAGNILEGLAGTDTVLYIASISVPVVGACGLLTLPISRSLMSKQTQAEHQGAVFAVIGAVDTLAYLVSSVLSNALYAHTVDKCRGCTFFVFASFNASCLLLMLIYRFKSRRSEVYKLSSS